MLNDFFITRDAINFLQNYLDAKDIALPGYREKLLAFSQKQLMSYEQWWALLESLNAELNQPALGLEIGRLVKVEHCGVLGYLFRTSRNLGEALNCYKRFERLIYAGSTITTGFDNIGLDNADSMRITWDPKFGYSSQLSDELLLASIVNITREIVSPYVLNPSQISFTQSIDNQHITTYQAFFGCEVRQNEKQLSITFKLSDLACPIPHEDQTLHDILGLQAEELLKHLPENDLFLADLGSAIIRCLHEGRPNVQSVATHLHLSPRTLHRRLKEKNREFRNILKSVRKSMAQNYLSDDKLTLAEVTLLLGYSEQSSFTRAFSTWFGESPAQYKRSHSDH